MRSRSVQLRHSSSRACVVGVLAALLFGRLGCSTAQMRSDAPNEPANAHSTDVLVTAKRHLTDDQMKQVVETALADNPYIYAEHITISARNGVVTVEGIVGDAGELLMVLRLARKVSGSKRVVSELVIDDSLPDGG